MVLNSFNIIKKIHRLICAFTVSYCIQHLMLFKNEIRQCQFKFARHSTVFDWTVKLVCFMR